MHNIHINLISEQIIPNLIPTLSDPDCIGVILIFGDDTMDEKANRLEQIYSERGIPILWSCHGNSSHNLPKLKEQAVSLITYLKDNFSDKRWVLNATCGTKPMSLAMTMAFYQHNSHLPENMETALILYTDSQNKSIPLLNDNVDYQLPYRSVLSLEELLAANGFMMMSATDKHNDQIVLDRAELTEFLGHKFSSNCRRMFSALHGMATGAAKDFPINKRQTMSSIPHGAYAEVYLRLNDEGLLIWNGESNEIEFCSENACRYLAGLWLEELTYLQALKCGFEEVAMSVEGLWGDKYDRENAQIRGDVPKGNNNEFDVLIRHKNQLLTIECKARYWDGKSHDSSESTHQDVMHKLDNLGNKLGGLFARNLLVSAFSISEAMKKRASDNRIKVCDDISVGKIKRQFDFLFKEMD